MAARQVIANAARAAMPLRVSARSPAVLPRQPSCCRSGVPFGMRALSNHAPAGCRDDVPLPPPHLPPDELEAVRFTRDHTWVKLTDDGLATVGITEYAAKTLGDAAFAELPRTNIKITASDSIGALESVKAAAELYSPVSGSISRVNEELVLKPSLITRSPLDKGWFCKIKFSDYKEVESLMTEDQYNDFLKGCPKAD